MQTIVKTSQPHDLLALVPQLVGFQPHDSLVLVAFRGKRTSGAYRIDLPQPSSDLVYKRVATTLIGMLCRIRGADGVVPVVYTDDSFGECGGIPRETLVKRLMNRAHTAGFQIKEALCVASDGWGSYFDDPDAGPHPLALIDRSAVHTSVPKEFRSALLPPTERARLPECDPVHREQTAEEILRLRGDAALRGVADGETDDHADTTLDGWTNPVGVAEVALRCNTGTLSPGLIAVVALAAESAPVRDVLLFDWAWGPELGRSVHRTNLRHQNGAVITDEDEGALGLAGMGMPQPDPERIDRAIELLRHVAACVPESVRPPLLTMLGWLHWALGSGSTAGLFVEHARSIDPRYGLAELLDTMLQNGMLPEWAFEQHGADPDATVVSIPPTDG